MDNPKYSIMRVAGEDRRETDDAIVRELPLTIFLNEKELLTLPCFPSDLDSLAIGFLFSEGLLKNRDEIQGIIVDDREGVVQVKTSADIEPHSGFLSKQSIITPKLGKGTSSYKAADVNGLAKVESQVVISAHEVFTLVHEFQHRSPIYRATGGVHSAALCDTKGILVFAEDIGKHNAIDKVLGHCLLKNIPTDDRIMLVSGRIPSGILLKVAKRKIPIIISVSASTDLGVRLARDSGITLIGFVRGNRMNIYANDWRVV